MTTTNKFNQNWWQSAVVYQVYPQSFKDTNRDGIGDLNGIIDKIPYLKTLGVDVLWLNPIYASPQVDNGYDISDYYQLNPEYGTINDFKHLLQIAHDNEIKIILDLVVNHTSDQHEWFQASRKSRDNYFSNYYIWKDPAKNGDLPNNWGATFGGPAWTYVPERQQYYLHSFAPQQPELNWEEPKLRQSIYEMMRYWLSFGVDGFRMDVISLISKRQDFPDADDTLPYSKSYYAGASNGPRVHEFLQEMNREVLSNFNTLTVGETPNTSSDQAILYTDESRHELNMVFNFDHMHIDYGERGKFDNKRFQLTDLKRVLTEWQNKLNDHGWNSLYWSNHDQPRAVSRFGSEVYRVESAKTLGTVLHMLKGTPYIFQGEEIGMTNAKFSALSDYKDIETKNIIDIYAKEGLSEKYIKEVAYLRSRDNARTPMPWNGTPKFAGFSDVTPWLKMNPNYQTINVESALRDNHSVFYHYQKLIKLRHELPVIVNGKYQLYEPDNDKIYTFTREAQDGTMLLIVASFTDQTLWYAVPAPLREKKSWRVLIDSYEQVDQYHDDLQLSPYQSIVFIGKD
ncbi:MULTISPECIES: alpha-glucosidase [Leuconostoc]|uniref:Oligo-1,6-glucosidase n=2 Tax=Leuconostoc kimchii TaxID=136609 RepID=D5T0A1_LEUKI|nr:MULTISPECIES: alpha-glucosidase [Leuconostoc]ADG39700.1 oligo-1,6-glucosidase [Leuconostoc kimchii IMSNU 11154]AEJ30439.1 oligo-1,6-glucosidase [Leuconostoc sp. C2]QBR47500.1 alpha-glucosidase [Leuconostoc kimchii]